MEEGKAICTEYAVCEFTLPGKKKTLWAAFQAVGGFGKRGILMIVAKRSHDNTSSTATKDYAQSQKSTRM